MLTETEVGTGGCETRALLALARRYIVHTGEIQSVNLTLVGCGGTGSFLALHLARLAWHARERHHLKIEMVFIDPDRVEPKNLGRQNFVPAELGQYKAEGLATRYSRAFGLSVRFVNESLDRERWPFRRGYMTLDVMVGCVDNAAARRAIQHLVAATENSERWRGVDCEWWLDCGNHDTSGQVLIGNSRQSAPMVNPLGFCTGLPLPSVQHPELMVDEPAPVIRCADAALADIQSLMINQQMAGWAANYLYRLIIARDLDIYATYLDMATGSARSEAIYGGE